MKVSKSILEAEDFLASSIWRDDRDAEKFSPVVDLDDEIESIGDLFFRVKIETPQGLSFDGFVSGIGDVGMGIFANGKMYAINSNFPKFSIESVTRLLADDPGLGPLEASSLFPLRFTTMIEREPIREFSGEIDLRVQ